ncbi:hypothetical protein ACVU7I_05095 [Patulibacter sp. S7RM1-6]
MNQEPLWARHNVARDGPDIEVLPHPAVNFAFVHNRVPLMRSVQVRNTGEEPQIAMTATVYGHSADLPEPCTRTFGGELGRDCKLWFIDLSTVHATHEHLAGPSESHPARLRVVASRSWGDDAEMTIPIDVAAARSACGRRMP